MELEPPVMELEPPAKKDLVSPVTELAAPTRDLASPTSESPFSEGLGDEKVLVIHSQEAEEEVEKEFKCILCGARFGQQPSLARHQKHHAGERAFICAECGKGFSLKHNLIIHQRTHTGERPYQCGVCQKSFSLKQNLLTHQRTHTGEKPFPCPRCARRFRERRFLLSHQRTHEARPGPAEPRGTDPGPFACDRCGKRSGCRGGRGCGEAHGPAGSPRLPRRGRASRDPFQCPQCAQSFSRKLDLAAHQRTHGAQNALT